MSRPNCCLGVTTNYRILHGHDAPPAKLRQLKAGLVSAVFDGTDLRHITLGGQEIVRRICAAVRDASWGTVLPELSGYEIETGAEEFRIAYRASYREGELDLSAEIAIDGRADGRVRFTFHGMAGTDFPYCRIGVCVLHPPAASGRRYRAESPEGASEGELPALIGPQLIRDGRIYALFPPFRRLAISMAQGLEVDFSFEGDLFEMEDQRNWTDASFKTYSTPLALGFPHWARRGQSFTQSVEVGCPQRAAHTVAEPAASEGSVSLVVGRELRPRLPAIGLGMSSVTRTLSEREAALLRAAAPEHVRVDLHTGHCEADLRAAAAVCERIGAGLEVALFVDGDTAAELERVTTMLTVPVSRFFVFKEGSACSDAALIRTVRSRLIATHPRVRFFGGTDVYFADLNRARPDPDGMDGLVFPITPQVHDRDETSLMENAEAQGDAVRTALTLAGGTREVAVSPVTLRPRSNPHANRPVAADPRELPPQVDPRQASLFAAAWTVASLKHIIEAGATSVTYYETVGWRGLIETEEGPPVPERFPARPGVIFPVYWVFRDLTGWRDAALLACDSTGPHRVTSLALRRGSHTRVLAANLTPEPVDVELRLDTGGTEATIAPIDAGSYDPVPARDPLADRRTSRVAVDGGRLRLPLNPYAVARIDS